MGRPANANKLWTREEHKELADLWDSGASLTTMAKAMKRSGSSVVAQLCQLGFLYYSQKAQGFCLVQPLYPMKAVMLVDKLMEAQSETAPPVADNLGNSPHA